MPTIRVGSTARSETCPELGDDADDHGSSDDNNDEESDRSSSRPAGAQQNQGATSGATSGASRRARRRQLRQKESEDDDDQSRPRRRTTRPLTAPGNEAEQPPSVDAEDETVPEEKRKPSKKERKRSDEDRAENPHDTDRQDKYGRSREQLRSNDDASEEKPVKKQSITISSRRTSLSKNEGSEEQIAKLQRDADTSRLRSEHPVSAFDRTSAKHNGAAETRQEEKQVSELEKSSKTMNGHAPFDQELSSDAGSASKEDLEASLKYLKSLPNLDRLAGSSLIDDLMSQYLPQKKTRSFIQLSQKKDEAEKRKPVEQGRDLHSSSPKPTTPSIGEQVTPFEKVEELNKEVLNMRPRRKQPPPPTRPMQAEQVRHWVDPRAHQRFKVAPKIWPPPGGPDDRDSYVVESYGQTDPYSRTLIKNIQKEKRQELEKQEQDKRAEVQAENIKPVSTLRSTFTYKPPKPRPGVMKPIPNIAQDRDWIKHEKKPVEYDKPPDEPDWMTLIRNRRWKSTVKARFPCSKSDVYEFERRSTTPKNWKRLAKDKTALKMLSEMVGVGAEGEELFMRLASQRQKIEDEQAEIDRRAEEELMAYEVARESLGSEVAYNVQMDAPLPAARMRPVPGNIPSKGGSEASVPSSAGSAYPFTTSQLEAAFLTNQLLKLHPEEFRKLMSLERSRQATLRWQFSSDPFDSVHDHQYLPYEIALLASQEPRVQQAMKKLLGQSDGYQSVFSSEVNTPRSRSRRTRSEGFGSHLELDTDGYESSNSLSSAASDFEGRSRRKKHGPPPLVKPRGRSVSPSAFERRALSESRADERGNLKVPGEESHQRRSLAKDYEDDREIYSHGLLSESELKLSEELAQLQEITRTIGKEVEEDLRKFESSIETRKSAFMAEAAKADQWEKPQTKSEEIDSTEISSRRASFIEMERQSAASSGSLVDAPKVRHKVRRIKSDAQLMEVFRKRRAESDVAAAQSQGEQVQYASDTSAEISSLLQDINTTFGGEE